MASIRFASLDAARTATTIPLPKQRNFDHLASTLSTHAGESICQGCAERRGEHYHAEDEETIDLQSMWQSHLLHADDEQAGAQLHQGSLGLIRQSHLLHPDDEQAGAQLHPTDDLKTKPRRHEHLLMMREAVRLMREAIGPWRNGH